MLPPEYDALLPKHPHKEPFLSACARGTPPNHPACGTAPLLNPTPRVRRPQQSFACVAVQDVADIRSKQGACTPRGVSQVGEASGAANRRHVHRGVHPAAVHARRPNAGLLRLNKGARSVSLRNSSRAPCCARTLSCFSLRALGGTGVPQILDC